MSNNAQQTDTTVTDVENERQVYKYIPIEERLASMFAWVGASIAFGIGSGSFFIAVGTFLALFFLGSQMSLEMKKHRGCRKGD